jgi:hypothetical protein
LFRASAETLLEVAADPAHLGARIGFLSVLHTWGQNLMHHPHVHCVIPAGGLSSDQSHWVHPRPGFFLPVRVLSKIFRGKFYAALKNLFCRQKLQFHGSLASLAQPKMFAQFLRQLFRQNWVVYAKRPFGGPEHVLHYLARYTHRVAISNHRLLAFEDDKVTFRWKDYAHGTKKRKMTLSRRRISPALPAAHPAAWFHTHPPLRHTRQPKPSRLHPAVPSATRGYVGTTFAHSCRDHACGELGMPELRWSDDGHRAADHSADPVTIC